MGEKAHDLKVTRLQIVRSIACNNKKMLQLLTQAPGCNFDVGLGNERNLGLSLGFTTAACL